MSRAAVELAVPGHAVTLDIARDGRLVDWRIDGRPVIGAKSARPVESGMYAMAPWAGRIADNTVTAAGVPIRMPATHDAWALHGTVLDRPCRLVSCDASQAVLEQDLGGTWPWGGVLRVHWMVTGDALSCALELHADRDRFPAVIGLHPWFVRRVGDADLEWGIEGALMAERDSDYRLSGALLPAERPRGSYDDAFLSSRGRAFVEWPGRLRIDIMSSHRWFVVYDQEPGFVCVEPQTGPPNGVNAGIGGGVSWVEPGRPLRLRTEWRISRARPVPSG